MKHPKIVATIGPSSQSKTTLEQMIAAGLNVARLNFSHGSYKDHAVLVSTIREASTIAGHPVAVLQDLQGPRIRVGEVPEQGIVITKGDRVVLISQKEFNAYGQTEYIPVPIQFEQLHQSVKKGGSILIQDGIMDLTIERVVQKKIYCRVIQGGVIFSHKGLNAPGTSIEGDVITKKDRADLKFGIKQKVDYVALSFVKSANDIKRLRRLIPKKLTIWIIAKIERAEAVQAFDEIVEASDGIMIARGDLGVELGAAAVPLLQKEMITKCLRAGKPVIVATQMLESMTASPRPTRAEASDVANAIIDHADAIMLSAETATGEYPVKAIQAMSAIAEQIEPSSYDDISDDLIDHRRETGRQGIAHAAVELAESTEAAAIVVLCRNGNTAPLIGQLRPQHTKLIVFTTQEHVLRKLALFWGIHGLLIKAPKDKTAFLRTVRTQLRKHKLVAKGEHIVLVYGSDGKKTTELKRI